MPQKNNIKLPHLVSEKAFLDEKCYFRNRCRFYMGGFMSRFLSC